LSLGWPPATIRPPDVVLAVFIVVLGLLPVLGPVGNPALALESWFPLGTVLQPGERDFAYRPGVAFLGITVAGLLDHLFLVWRMRSFPPALASSSGGSAAV